MYTSTISMQYITTLHLGSTMKQDLSCLEIQKRYWTRKPSFFESQDVVWSLTRWPVRGSKFMKRPTPWRFPSLPVLKLWYSCKSWYISEGPESEIGSVKIYFYLIMGWANDLYKSNQQAQFCFDLGLRLE